MLRIAQYGLSLPVPHVCGAGGHHSVRGVHHEDGITLLDLGQQLVQRGVDLAQIVALDGE